MSSHTMEVIARIRTDFPDKFGIPRQSGLVETLEADIVFEPAYRNADALRGLEEYSHIWLIWQFSRSVREGDWSPTVRPPRLGGNTRMGVFATRSPFRPNPIGLSCVRLKKVVLSGPDGPRLRVCGADLVDGTPIYDIKPYLPYADAHPEAVGGFAREDAGETLQVEFPSELLSRILPAKQQGLLGVLARDPRPAYQNKPERVYRMSFAGMDVHFRVEDGVLRVCDVTEQNKPNE